LTAIPTDIAYSEPASERRRRSALTRSAYVYFWVVIAVALAVTLPFLAQLGPNTQGWATFFVLATGVAVAQLFVVVTPGHQSYHTTAVFLLPAALLLPPELVALMALAQHVPDWLKRRLPFHIQAFNIANYTLATMAAWGVAEALRSVSALDQTGVGALLVGGAAAVVFVGLNHLLLAPMLRFARGLSFRDSGLFTYDNLSVDLVLAALGVGLAMLWEYNPWLTPFALAPLVLVHRSLSVPALQAEARVDPKTGLYNARHFAAMLRDELGRAARFARPMSVIMADLDLLREINNSYGHLAGDAVLAGIAKIFREQLREYDVPARFGGEEFAILLPETPSHEAIEIAERIRRAVARASFAVETSNEPIRATVSFGVASYPRDGMDPNELVHQADLAVYRAKLQGRNRVSDASDEALLAQPDRRTPTLVTLPEVEDVEEAVQMLPPAPVHKPEVDRRSAPRPHATATAHFFLVPRRLAVLVGLVGGVGIAMGALGLVFGKSDDMIGLLAIVVLVGFGQALSLQVEHTGTISVSAVGALAGAAIIGPRAALPLAVTMAAIEWSARRSVFHQLVFNTGALTLASLAAAEVFAIHIGGSAAKAIVIGLGALAGLAYFAVNTGLLSAAIALEGRENIWRTWSDRFRWLTLHYAVYGIISAVIYEAYKPIGVWALVVFALPLLLMRKTQEGYLRHTERATNKLRAAAETIQSQNVSLEFVNRQLKERSTAAMESLSATVDARDEYTAGHSRRVQRIALTIGRQLDLSETELELLGHAALFHDIGKLAVPDSILLKPASLTDDEWKIMTKHAAEGASIINRLGFLNDAVPAIRHHHERFDGRGYPDRLAGVEIPLGARIIHVADAFDSMLSTRVYRPARSLDDALTELRKMAGSQFCPRCVAALDSVAGTGDLHLDLDEPEAPAAGTDEQRIAVAS
jgi:diguanylate cyclase (GGDEF)-like protein/putative nucleotidyltransferase with HDIG domain